jgi:hypothetical protein
MSELSPCPSCNRHVRVEETACPFCNGALPARPRDQMPATARPRLSRAALFTAGATLLGAAACSSSSNNTDAGAGGTGGTHQDGAAGTGGHGGSGGQDAGDAGPSGTDGPIAIYSAAFPPVTPRT